MSFYPLKFPRLIKYLFPNLSTNIPNNNKQIFLTFDDGPTPQVTEFVLDLLDKYNAKATFFCIGDKIEKHSEILIKIKQQGHKIGNHTFNHDDAWKTKNSEYLSSINKTEFLLKQNGIISNLFRPPFGRITPSKIKLLKKNNYKIIMWTRVAGDFSKNISPELVAEKLVKKTKQGDIIVFHDSNKAEQNLRKMLPIVLKGLFENNFIFSTIKIDRKTQF